MAYNFVFSVQGRSYKEFYSQQWVSKKPERFMVGIDSRGNEIYVGDTVRVIGNSKNYYWYQPSYKVVDCPTYSNHICLKTSHGDWPFHMMEVEVLEH